MGIESAYLFGPPFTTGSTNNSAHLESILILLAVITDIKRHLKLKYIKCKHLFEI